MGHLVVGMRGEGILQECPLSMVFIVALYAPWCWSLEVSPGMVPQLRSDNLKLQCSLLSDLLDVARLTVRFVTVVGQDVFLALLRLHERLEWLRIFLMVVLGQSN